MALVGRNPLSFILKRREKITPIRKNLNIKIKLNVENNDISIEKVICLLNITKILVLYFLYALSCSGSNNTKSGGRFWYLAQLYTLKNYILQAPQPLFLKTFPNLGIVVKIMNIYIMLMITIHS